MPENKFYRDASGRLAFEMWRSPADSYTAICVELMGAFGLHPLGSPIGDMALVFQDYQRGDEVVGLEWDNWSGYVVVAKSVAAEKLVHEIGAYLQASPWATLESTT